MKTLIDIKRGLILTAFFLFLFTGCAVQDWGSLKQAYRDFVSYYNGYFNARELIEQSRQQLEDNHSDQYDQILEVYPLGDENDVGGVRGNLESAIEKATKVIQGYENSNWVKDSYMLIGKARFYQREYEKALESFRYITSNFRETQTAFEAMIWIVITNTRMERYNEARSMVSLINSQDTIPAGLKKDFHLATADMQIKRNNFGEAITALEKATELISGRRDKARYNFILAQLHQHRGNMAEANKYYGKVASRPANYEMEFHARFNKVMTMEVDGVKQYREKKKLLLNMSEDSKNEDYLDQIYYELGRLELFINNRNEAIRFLKKSLAHNTDNVSQRSRSLHLLAFLQYQRKDYTPAHNNYKELVQGIDDNGFPGSDTLKRRGEHYKNITGYHQTIHLEDSLQDLAQLSDAALRRTLEQVIERQDKEAEKEDQRQLAADAAMEEDEDLEASMAGATQIQEGDWYFYNPNALRSGYQQFMNRYGERPDVDNWRYRSIMAAEQGDNGEFEEPDIEDGEDMEAGDTEESRDARMENLMAQIPRSGAQKNASDHQMMQAYFKLGYAYYENVSQYEKSITVLEELQERFPDNRFTANAYYLIHQSARQLNDADKAEKYRNKLQEDFPESEFTLLVKDPEEYRRRYVKQEANPELEGLFERAYAALQNDNCREVDSLQVVADTNFTTNYLETNFYYLTILCRVRQDTSDQSVNRLEQFANEHEESEFGPHARNVLEYIRKQKGSEEEKSGDISMFSNRETETHYYGFVFNLNEGNTQDIRERISDFNRNFLGNPGLRITDVLVGEEEQMILVRDFEDRSAAMMYYNNISENEYFKSDLNIEQYEQFIISESNYRALISHENKNAYLVFFEKYYE